MIEKIDDEPVLYMDGFDAALIGHVRRCGQPVFAVYSHEKLIEELTSQGMNYDEAVEYIDFNQVGAWVGDHTPGVLME